MRCGKCWGEGHTGFRCTTKMLNPAAMPYYANKPKPINQANTGAKPYDDLLLKPCPLAAPSLPSNRPKRLAYFANQDPAFLSEVERLNNGVVFDTHGLELGFKPMDVAKFAVRTQLVEVADISIAILDRDRFLIILPPGVASETFIHATCPALWDAGFSFQPWSPLDGARLVIPEYKALLTLMDVPPHLRRDKIIEGSISTFGTFLGTIPQQGTPNLSLWTVAVAVDRLERIPDELELHAAGLESIVKVRTDNWMRAPLYSSTDLPKHKPKYTKPVGKPQRPSEDLIYLSRGVLKELCKGLDPASLPEEIQGFLTGTKIPAMTIAQTEDLLHLRDTQASSSGTPHEAGLVHLGETGPTETATHLGISQTKPISSTDSGADDESGQPKARKETTHRVKRIVPQKIPTLVRILQRNPPQKMSHPKAPIPRPDIYVQEPSASQRTDVSCQSDRTRSVRLSAQRNKGKSVASFAAQRKDKGMKFTREA